MDWQGLLRVGLHQLGLQPAIFWSLTPYELSVMAGTLTASDRFSRQTLTALSARYPDKK